MRNVSAASTTTWCVFCFNCLGSSLRKMTFSTMVFGFRTYILASNKLRLIKIPLRTDRCALRLPRHHLAYHHPSHCPATQRTRILYKLPHRKVHEYWFTFPLINRNGQSNPQDHRCSCRVGFLSSRTGATFSDPVIDRVTLNPHVRRCL